MEPPEEPDAGCIYDIYGIYETLNPNYRSEEERLENFTEVQLKYRNRRILELSEPLPSTDAEIEYQHYTLHHKPPIRTIWSSNQIELRHAFNKAKRLAVASGTTVQAERPIPIEDQPDEEYDLHAHYDADDQEEAGAGYDPGQSPWEMEAREREFQDRWDNIDDDYIQRSHINEEEGWYYPDDD
jgi:hypothetical protein